MRTARAATAGRLIAGTALAAALLCTAHATRAADVDLPRSDRAAIRRVITEQMAAFQRHDAKAAFQRAAPAIQDMFGTPENFMMMVRREYPPIYEPRSFLFGDLDVVAGELTQSVTVVDHDGNPFAAFYLMAHQGDGSWRIQGCILVPIEHSTI
jgi:hypothetical protein